MPEGPPVVAPDAPDAPDARDAREASIVAMRAAIDNVDRSLIELVARRRSIVAEILAAKRGLSLPLVDPAREAELVADRRAFAAALGVSGDLAERVVRLLLDDSHEMIERLLRGS